MWGEELTEIRNVVFLVEDRLLGKLLLGKLSLSLKSKPTTTLHTFESH